MSERRLVGLDGIRGLAALFVMLHHCWLLLRIAGYDDDLWIGWCFSASRRSSHRDCFGIRSVGPSHHRLGSLRAHAMLRVELMAMIVPMRRRKTVAH